jgi:hypothetical protein
MSTLHIIFAAKLAWVAIIFQAHVIAFLDALSLALCWTHTQIECVRLLAIAFAADALISFSHSVGFVVSVPLRAVCFLSAYTAYLRAALNILFVRHRLKVIWSPTRAIAARVIQFLSGRHGAFGFLIGNDVRPARSAFAVLNNPVSVFVQIAGEIPTARYRIDSAHSRESNHHRNLLTDILACRHSVSNQIERSGLREAGNFVAARSYFSAKVEAFA